MMPRSRSLEIFSDPATWSREVEEIQLTKGEAGLGFSILDYQDPMDDTNSVIVVRGLVPGGAAMQVVNGHYCQAGVQIPSPNLRQKSPKSQIEKRKVCLAVHMIQLLAI